MAKRLTNIQKDEILKKFQNGNSVSDLSEIYNCTKNTIIRNLKKALGEKQYKKLAIKKSINQKNGFTAENSIEYRNNKDLIKEDKNENKSSQKELNGDLINYENMEFSTFTEIVPLDQDIDNLPQKDISSVPISEIDFPKIVFMIVDKKIELEIKLLKDYPEWSFLSEKELERKTIKIYEDLKTAKRFCNVDQKVIKVPNTKVFEIVAPILNARGISRIVSEKVLISL